MSLYDPDPRERPTVLDLEDECPGCGTIPSERDMGAIGCDLCVPGAPHRDRPDIDVSDFGAPLGPWPKPDEEPVF